MKFKVFGKDLEFEIPSEWWESAGMHNFVPSSECYAVNPTAYSAIVSVEEIECSRANGELWFRNRDSVIEVLRKLRNHIELEPISVWSKEKTGSDKYRVRDGFHRFYLSVAAGYKKMPVKIDDFDLSEFLEQERRGIL
jgi:hypothetical protein